ncbi:hypothetical protein CEP54_009520 [Fusarium duplospermum]|uniref:Uncharacterized protein n=1 Tax=Fusarium duplospermum TaxID=1325734 RepID=A0A428PQ16_9HYPO|nr:hypothetical protein CEP54_009520 [Fusarium duplospermum]
MGYRGAVSCLARIHTAEGVGSFFNSFHRSYAKLCVTIEACSIGHRNAIESVCFLLQWVIRTFIYCVFV